MPLDYADISLPLVACVLLAPGSATLRRLSMHRAHLFSLRFAHALREALAEGYGLSTLLKDCQAGLTVGVIAIPLAMALAIASGVPPQQGLYTAVVGGFIIALLGGSRFSVSGPTAAFVVILAPIAQRFGLSGLLLATFMAGLMLIAMAYARLGRLIEYIPEPVTMGFTCGIAAAIACLQFKDMLGLAYAETSTHFVEKMATLFAHAPSLQPASVMVAAFTIVVFIAWRKLKTPIPPHIPSILGASILSYILMHQGFDLDTIGTRFRHLGADGETLAGIPNVLPSLQWPWLHAGPGGRTLPLSVESVSDLLPAAFAIAMLGAIESLLCAVVLDQNTGKRHSANSELFAQGVGNVIAPFFGGISATAAIARSSANLRAGAQTPIAAALHALVVLGALLLFSPLFNYLPMPALAALLVMVAWGMAEVDRTVRVLRRVPARDLSVFFTVFLLTLFFDMVIAITAGILLASLLFMQEIASMSKVIDVTEPLKDRGEAVPEDWRVYKIYGPLFFAAADRIFSELADKVKNLNGAILHVEAVPLLDAGGVAAMGKLIDSCERRGVRLYFCEWQFQPLRTLARAGVQAKAESLRFFPDLSGALKALNEKVGAAA